MPELHKRSRGVESVVQMVFLLLGLGLMAFVSSVLTDLLMLASKFWKICPNVEIKEEFEASRLGRSLACFWFLSPFERSQHRQHSDNPQHRQGTQLGYDDDSCGYQIVAINCVYARVVHAVSVHINYYVVGTRNRIRPKHRNIDVS